MDSSGSPQGVLSMQKDFNLRPAVIGDAEKLFCWRNEKATREQFRNTDIVQWTEHSEWFRKILDGLVSGQILAIAECNGVSVGVVRADFYEDEELFELSYTIAPEMRNKGLGILMVKQFVAEYLPGKKIRLSIRKGNAASEKIAERLGLEADPKSSGKQVGEIVSWS